MNKPIILAGQSMVLNGDFDKAFNSWCKGPINPSALSPDREMYGGIMTPLLAAGLEASVHQELTVPWSLGDDAQYVLKFLFESRHDAPARFLVEVIGKPDLSKEITLPARASEELQRCHDKLAGGAPMAFEPTAYEVKLDMPLEQGDRIMVSVLSPKNPPGNFHFKICITRIRLDLHLVPLVLQRLQLDEEVWEQWEPTQTLHLCLGAESLSAHRLRLVAREDSPWSATGASLSIDGNPLGSVIATPDWDVDQSLDEQWSLVCPVLGEAGPYLFTLNLLNQYMADPYPVKVSLGHHRLVFRERQEPAYFPVLEYAQSVRVGVQVASHYTGQFIGRKTVRWGIKGQTQTTAVVTDDSGWAYFDFLPESAGDLTLQATVDSPYFASGVVTTDIDVRVLATDPWKEVMAVAGGVSRWEEKTGYPNRGSTYRLGVRLPEHSPLLGTDIAILSQGTSLVQLGVAIEPELERMIPVDTPNLFWELTCEDRLDGVFSLVLECSKLKLPSAPKRMSLARNVVRIGDVQEANKYPVVDEEESVLLRVQVVHVVTSGNGDPVQRALVDWAVGGVVLERTLSGSGGWASFLYRPQSPGEQLVTAIVSAHEEAVTDDYNFKVTALPTSPWKNQVIITVDGVPLDLVDLGIVCRRGGSHVLKVVPSAGSPLLNQPVTLNWRGSAPVIGLTVSNLGTARPLAAGGLEWTFNSPADTSVSSLFALTLSSVAVSAPRELFGRLLSANLADEFSLMLDQVPALAGDTFYPCLAAKHDYRVLPNVLSPLVGLNVRLDWSGTSADELNADVQPPTSVEQTLSDGGFNWTLDFSASLNAGEFSLQCAFAQLSAVAPGNAMFLDHNKLRIDSYRETAVDPVINQDTAWQWVRVVSVFSGLPVMGAVVNWQAQDNLAMNASDQDGWSGYGLKPTTAGRHSILASVTSRFDEFEEFREMTVDALPNDPWQGVLMGFDGQEPRPFGEFTCFPRRKGEHSLEILAEADSPLLDRNLTLGMTGTGPTELGIRFTRGGLGVPRWFSSVGLEYSFTCDDLKDGSFNFCLAAERLANLSPGNAMSLGQGAQVMKIESLTQTHQTLDWDEELIEQVKVVASTTGRPMVGVTVTWEHADLGRVTRQTDFYGIARIRFTPRTTGAGALKATVGDQIHSQSIDLPFTLNDPRKIIELYEPEGSRQPSDEPQAFARAKVVSALTGEPLAGVLVYWEFSGRALNSSLTDATGVANLTFTFTAQEQPILSATVRGGIAGWDYAQLLYGGLIPEIKSLTSPNADLFLGSEATATVTVISSADGQPLEGIRVGWTFPGVLLPDTTTGAGGRSTIRFVPTRAGTPKLTASAGLGPSVQLEFSVVEQAELVEMTLSSPVVYLRQPVTATVRLLKGHPDGTLVTWRFNRTVVGSSTVTEGLTSCTYTPTEFTDSGFALFEARIYQDSLNPPSTSMNVWVTSTNNELARGSLFYINDTPVLIPNFPNPVRIRQGKEVALKLVLVPEKGLEGHFMMLPSDHRVTLEPRLGTSVPIVDQFTWKMVANMEVGTPFAMAVTRTATQGSIGAVFEVVAPDAEVDVVEVQEQPKS